MKPATTCEIIVIVILAIALVIYLVIKNIKDEQDIAPGLGDVAENDNEKKTKDKDKHG